MVREGLGECEEGSVPETLPGRAAGSPATPAAREEINDRLGRGEAEGAETAGFPSPPSICQLPEPPSALPPPPLPCPPAGRGDGGSGGTNLRGGEHSPRRKREPADGGAAGAAGGVSWEAPAPWAGTGRARGGRDGGWSSLLAHAGPNRVRRSPSAPGDSSRSLPRGGSAIHGRP